MILFYLITFIFALIIYKFYKIITKNNDYWKKRCVPYVEPKLLFGNFFDSVLSRKSAPLITTAICKQFPDAPYIGVLFGTEPGLIVKDLDIIKLVLTKDFNYFNGREVTDYANREPITKNVFFNGGDEWKVCRQYLTPLFTSSKLKLMFPLIKNCFEDLEKYIADEVKISQILEGKSLLNRYTMECIINCAFGMSANTLKKNEAATNPFITISNKIFETSIIRGLKISARLMWPSIFYNLGFQIFDDGVANFFHSLFSEVTAERKFNKSSRNDFVDLLLTWRKDAYISGKGFSNKIGENKEIKIEANDDLLASQCMLIFASGFDTTSSSINFLLFELAKHQDAQDKVIKEIDDYLKKNNGNIEYDCVNELPYTEACLEESLRLYPILATVTREVMDDYTLPTGLHLQRGLRIQIPVHYIHTNPEYFEDPHEFRPERMLGDAKNNIKPYTFMPFGEGPRMCLGLRFAKMTLYPCLVTILKNYRLELTDTVPNKLDFKPATFVTQPLQDVNFRFIRRVE